MLKRRGRRTDSCEMSGQDCRCCVCRAQNVFICSKFRRRAESEKARQAGGFWKQAAHTDSSLLSVGRSWAARPTLGGGDAGFTTWLEINKMPCAANQSFCAYMNCFWAKRSARAITRGSVTPQLHSHNHSYSLWVWIHTPHSLTHVYI